MKRIETIKYLMMAVLTVVCMTFTACGDDDKEYDPGYGKTELLEGVHRIEVSFKNAENWRASVMFIGTYHEEAAELYEDGEKIGRGKGYYVDGGVRNYNIESEAKCDDMVVTLSLNPLVMDDPGELEVTLKGYVNGKQTNMKVYTVTKDGYRNITFYAQDYGADVIR